jgi:hypothetical protein
MKLENTVDRTDLSHIPLQAMRFNDGESGRWWTVFKRMYNYILSLLW